MDALKDKLQHEALSRWELAGRKGTLVMATGTGKSRVPILRIEELYEEYGEHLRILLAVPTTNSRDVVWPNEAVKWKVAEIFKGQVETFCWVSFSTKPQGHYHLVILDEAHHLTENNNKFVENITYDEIMAFTATPPDTSSVNGKLLDKIAPTVFTYSLDEAVEDNISADYEIYVIEMPLNDTAKTIKAGNKKKRFYQTEKSAYDYINRTLTKVILSDADNKEDIINSIIRRRAKFLYDLPSKQVYAKLILNKIRPGNKILVFGGTKKQIEFLCGDDVYHSGTDGVALKKFKNNEISSMGSIRALDEGENIDDLDSIFIVQTTSKSRQATQRIGRVVRKRPGHKAIIYVLSVTGTEDEKWVKSSLEGFDRSKIFYISYKNFIDE